MRTILWLLLILKFTKQKNESLTLATEYVGRDNRPVIRVRVSHESILHLKVDIHSNETWVFCNDMLGCIESPVTLCCFTIPKGPEHIIHYEGYKAKAYEYLTNFTFVNGSGSEEEEIRLGLTTIYVLHFQHFGFLPLQTAGYGGILGLRGPNNTVINKVLEKFGVEEQVHIFTKNEDINRNGSIIIGHLNHEELSPYSNGSETTYTLVQNSILINGIQMYDQNLTYRAKYLQLSPFGDFALSLPPRNFVLNMNLEEASAVYRTLARQAVCESRESLSDCTCSGKISDQFPEIYLVGKDGRLFVIDSNRYMQKKIIGKTIKCMFFIETEYGYNETNVLLGKYYLKDYLVSYPMNGDTITLVKLYDVYWNYDLTAILVTLLIVMVLVSTCIILMVRHDRKSAKEDIIKRELWKRQQQQRLRKDSDL